MMRIRQWIIPALSLGAVAPAQEPAPAPGQPAQIHSITSSRPAETTRRRYTEQIHFQAGDSVLPADPRQRQEGPPIERETKVDSIKPQSAREMDIAPRPMRAFDPAMLQQWEKASKAANWIRPARLKEKDGSRDREWVDRNLGIRDERDALRDGRDSSSADSETKDERFGDFFERMQEQHDPLNRIDREHEAAARKDKDQERGKTQDSASRTRSANGGDLEIQPTAFQPLIGGQPDAGVYIGRPGRQNENGDSRGERVSDTVFTPTLADTKPRTTREAAKEFERPRDNPFSVSTAQLGSSAASAPGAPNAGLGAHSAAAAGAEVHSIRSLASYDTDPNRYAGRPSTSSAGLASPSFLASPEISTASRNAGAGFSGIGSPAATPAPAALRSPLSFTGAPAPVPVARFSPPPAQGPAVMPGSAGFQSAFSSLRPAAALPPAVETAPRGDRWERDRTRSQLAPDRGATPGARRSAP